MKTYYINVTATAWETVKANSKEEALEKFKKMTLEQRKRRLTIGDIEYELFDEYEGKYAMDGIYSEDD